MPHLTLPAGCPNLKRLYLELKELKAKILSDTEAETSKMMLASTEPENLLSLLNMFNYVTMRRNPIHQLQSGLAMAGLSSLGRVEPHVMNNIDIVIQRLKEILSETDETIVNHQFCIDYDGGYGLLKKRKIKLFGELPKNRTEYIMVTMPSESAKNEQLVDSLFASGMDCARINCAHDNSETWLKMIQNIRKAEKKYERGCHILMDLAGQKIRTGDIWVARNKREKRKGELKPPLLVKGDFLILCKKLPESKDKLEAFPEYKKADVIVSCTYANVIDMVKPGEMLWFDDGKIGCLTMDITDEALLLKVQEVGPKGSRLKQEKGINLPQTSLDLPTLSPKDHEDLVFVSQYADMVGLSFTETANDVVYLQKKLNEMNGRNLPILAKIETEKGCENLPKIVASALARNLDFGVMIARGDLAVELGSVRMAEIQDEIIRLCESAHTPLIWATQVLESLAKKGTISRPEISDAAMSQRAECVMLNKGPYIVEAVNILSEVLQRMEHQQFKSHTHLKSLDW